MAPGAAAGQVVLFAQWLAWVFHVDDQWDEAGDTDGGAAVRAAHERFLGIVRGTVAARAGEPAEVALADLWARTAPRASRHWQERFAFHLGLQRDAFARQAELRRRGLVPGPGEYRVLRRHANCPAAFHLLEPLYREEMPLGLVADWVALTDAVNDVTAWCNDLASVEREAACGDPTNYVTVLRHHLGLSADEAARQVRLAVTHRMADIARGRRALLDRSTSPSVGLLAGLLADVPGRHLAWVRESGRYRAGVDRTAG
ncbi:hypothetical protein EF918_34775 [Streptomyces sp. WAC06614]|nr:hypothetical protein EF918_34775 [Streptomyces sp. WAC06614]